MVVAESEKRLTISDYLSDVKLGSTVNLSCDELELMNHVPSENGNLKTITTF